MVHSITHAIPLTPQTDPNKFPRGEYRPYPRMMVRKDNDKPFTDVTGRHPVIVQDEDEEREFRDAHPGEVRDNVPSAADTQDELTRLREENARLKAERSGDSDAKAASPLRTSVADLARDPDKDPPADPAPQAAKLAARPTVRRKLD